MFRDRLVAARELLAKLKKYEDDPNSIVLGLPRGGVVTAHVIAQGLHLPLDILSLRKIGAPQNPELALGAVSATGEVFLNQDLIELLGVSLPSLEAQIKREQQNAIQRFQRFRQQRKPLDISEMTVLIVDDGLATGATMQAAILTAKAQGAAKVVAVVPVAAPDSLQAVQDIADEVIYLLTPIGFRAVGEFYEIFDQVEDEEVIRLLA